MQLALKKQFENKNQQEIYSTALEISNPNTHGYSTHIQLDSNSNPCAYPEDIQWNTRNQKNNMHQENFIKLQIENYDINVQLEDIQKQNIDIQLDYFYHVFELLKYELNNEKKFANTVLDENDELRETNIKLENEIIKVNKYNNELTEKYNDTLSKARILQNEYNLIQSKDKKYLRIKKDKRIIKQQQKQIKQMQKDNINFKDRLDNVVNAPITDNQTEQILMMHVEGISQKDIATKLNIAQSTVSRKINSKANQKLIEELQERLCV